MADPMPARRKCFAQQRAGLAWLGGAARPVVRSADNLGQTWSEHRVTPYVVSERTRNVSRDESYSRSPGPAIPGGVMHAFDEAAQGTLCGLAGPGLHHWPGLDFPRYYGTHCDPCSQALARTSQDPGSAD